MSTQDETTSATTTTTMVLLAGATGIIAATGIAWALNSGDTSELSSATTTTPTVTRGVAPEIDAASGTSAIALLTGVLFLVGERFRSRCS